MGRVAPGRGSMLLKGSKGGDGRCRAVRVADVMEAERRTSSRFLGPASLCRLAKVCDMQV